MFTCKFIKGLGRIEKPTFSERGIFVRSSTHHITITTYGQMNPVMWFLQWSNCSHLASRQFGVLALGNGELTIGGRCGLWRSVREIIPTGSDVSSA